MELAKENKKFVLLTIIAVISVSFIILYAGHFLLGRPENTPDYSGKAGDGSALKKRGPAPFPIRYRHLTEEVNGCKQEINILEIDLNNDRVRLFPVLSHDKVFGFEKLSEMVLRSKAYAAVNGGFFHEYGEPGGMVVIDGEIITNSTGKYPVLLIEDKKASLKEISMKLRLESDDLKLDITGINILGNPGGTVVYTPAFGTTNRAKAANVTAVIENNTVTEIGLYQGEVKIPERGMLLTFFRPFKYDQNSLPIKEGDRVKITSDPPLGSKAQAYECGSWIVRNGQIVVRKYDAWVGVMTNRDPRTVVGLKGENTVVLFTVDGRQPGYSAGLTGKELAETLLKYGIRDAAMLDGGASTEMIVNNKVVNRPSFNGQERPLGGAVVVKYK